MSSARVRDEMRLESSDAGPEEERQAEPGAATHALSGLEDPAISEDALEDAEASRRAHLEGPDAARVGGTFLDSAVRELSARRADPRDEAGLARTKLSTSIQAIGCRAR